MDRIITREMPRPEALKRDTHDALSRPKSDGKHSRVKTLLLYRLRCCSNSRGNNLRYHGFLCKKRRSESPADHVTSSCERGSNVESQCGMWKNRVGPHATQSLWSLRCFTVHGGHREPHEPLTPRFKPSTAEYPAAAPLSTAPKIRGDLRGDRGRETGFRTGTDRTEQKNFHGWIRSQDTKRERGRARRARFDKRIYLRVAFSRNRTLLGNVYKQRLFQRARVLLLL